MNTYDKNKFNFTSILEENYPLIRSEIENVTDGYVDGPFQNWKRTGKGVWDIYGLTLYGNEIEKDTSKFPITFNCLKSVKGLHAAGFVKLGKHSHLKAHAGREWKSVLNTEKKYLNEKNLVEVKENKIPVLRAHLTLINTRPDLTRLRVWTTPPETITKDIVELAEQGLYTAEYVDMTWHEGLVHVFDDTYLHEAKNDSDYDRLILLFDFDKREYGYQPRNM